MRTQRDAGFTYLAVLFLVAIFGILLAATGMIWSTAQKREKERDLLFVGHQFRKAIGEYYERTPGTVKRYPNSFNDLLKDNRQLSTVRYLRRIYKDPLTTQSEWG
ncbi:MAG: type II secretion system protein, partial [Burkholderiaceae bacterium]